MANKILKYTLSFFFIIFYFLSWREESNALNHLGKGNWIEPIIWFTLFFVSLYLVSIIIKEKKYVLLLISISFLLSLAFAIYFWHLIFIVLSVFIAFAGVLRIKKDLNLNIKVDIPKSLGFGKALIILAISIVIASQYAVEIKNKGVTDLIPRIENMPHAGAIINSILGTLNPNFKNLSQDGVTVDEFILKSQKDQLEKSDSPISNEEIEKMVESQVGKNIPLEQRMEIKKQVEEKINFTNSQVMDVNQKMIIEESRKKISEMVGKNLTGQEKMSDVFSEMINKKISDFVRTKDMSASSMPVLPLILAIILFLSAYSLASFLNIFWTQIIRLVFWIFVKCKFVTISIASKEVEIIE